MPMRILNVKPLEIDAVRIIKFARFCDRRGYFTEQFRKSDFSEHPEMSFMQGVEFVQANESYSKKGTVRGLHFQWNPYMGKLVRTLVGRMVDMVLDIRKGSPSFGKIMLYDMPVKPESDYSEWIWVPPGFAHGNFFTENTTIEYFCSGRYSPGCEAGISPLSKDIDWSLCDNKLKELYKKVVPTTELITDKDRNGFSVEGWKNDERSDNFVYGRL
jgi:dTDP-4-dehydrorhamnose 3,5-epimerase